MDANAEVFWRRVSELPLEASMSGKVRRADTKELCQSKSQNTNGYQYVRARVAGIVLHLPTHRVVCAAFHGLPQSSKHVAAHSGNDKNNNGVYNLRWATQSENMDDKWEHYTEQVGEKHPRAKVTEEFVINVRRVYDRMREDNGGRMPKGSIGELCQRFKISKTHLEHIVYRGSWKEVD